VSIGGRGLPTAGWCGLVWVGVVGVGRCGSVWVGVVGVGRYIRSALNTILR
jgi:hypothetical protein